MSDPRITDEAVEAATRTHVENSGWDWDDLSDWDKAEHEENKRVLMADMRLALEAALPHLEPHPTKLALTAAIDAVEIGAGSEHYRHGRETMRNDAVSAVQDLHTAAPQPVVDREALAEVINEVAVSTGLAKYFKSGGVEDPSDVEEFVAAVLALLNGGAK